VLTYFYTYKIMVKFSVKIMYKHISVNPLNRIILNYARQRS
jgi:hypothetical protein